MDEEQQKQFDSHKRGLAINLVKLTLQGDVLGDEIVKLAGLDPVTLKLVRLVVRNPDLGEV